MKKLIVLFALAAMAFAAQAQNKYIAVTMLDGGTNNVPTSTTSTIDSQVLDLTKQQEVAIQFSFKCSGANTDNLKFTFSESADAVTYSTLNQKTFDIAANGTSVVCLVTNISCKGIGYMKLVSIANTNASAWATNVTVKYAVKN